MGICKPIARTVAETNTMLHGSCGQHIGKALWFESQNALFDGIRVSDYWFTTTRVHHLNPKTRLVN